MEMSRRKLFALGGAAAAVAAVGVNTPALAQQNPTQTWHSELVRPGPDGRLEYHPDAYGNRIPDFSWAGYHNGERPIPEVPVVKSIRPVSGDNTEHIQQAIDAVSALPINDQGFRGALLLEAGLYEVAGHLSIRESGVVLRGVGKEIDTGNNTVIRATGGGELTRVIRMGGQVGDMDSQVPDTLTDITSEVVETGDRTFTVADASGLRVGHNIMIHHPHTAEWNDAIGGGGVREEPPWPVGTRPIIYNRYIKEISGNEITVCAPVFNRLDRSLSQTHLYAWDQAGLIREVGIENLRIDMGYPDDNADENHPQSCIMVNGVQDAWIKDATLLHFSFAGVHVQRSTRVTVDNVRASHPRSQLIGSRRYNFCTGALGQQVLMRDLWASHARHAFATNGASRTSGNVWLDGFNDTGYSESGGHHRWSQGLLLDNIKELSSQSTKAWVISLHNRGDVGPGHGWSSVNSVAWNCTVDNGKRICVQRPPTGQNYAIGTTGAASGENWYDDIPAGHIEGTNQPGLAIRSLYEAQLADRLG